VADIDDSIEHHTTERPNELALRMLRYLIVQTSDCIGACRQCRQTHDVARVSAAPGYPESPPPTYAEFPGCVHPWRAELHWSGSETNDIAYNIPDPRPAGSVTRGNSTIAVGDVT
jgi:hypothetical protein